MMLNRYLENRYVAGNSSVSRLSPALDLSFMLTKLKNYSTDEYSTMDNNGMSVPPLACAFAKMPQYQHVLGVVDEDGYLVLYNTHKTGQAAIIKTWQVHANAVFDLEWLNEENKILTGSGDQTIALYDVETCQQLETFRGHASSIKSIASKVGDNAIFVSGSRDGHIMIWDKRIYHKDDAVPPVDTIFNAHMLQQQSTGKIKKKRQSHLVKDAQQSVTAVLFQNENYLVSAGAVDGCLKVWDIRKTYKRRATGAQPVHVFQYPGENARKHGYSSLVQDSQGRRLFASCTDDVIYEYDMAAWNPKPIQTWRGHKNSTFYVKASLSPDDQYLLSGSSDELAYIWQINKPSAAPITLMCHTAEVTSVSWCPNDITKAVTLSDDTKTKFWRVFCREMKKNFLPKFLGQAKRISKRPDTPRVIDVQVPPTSAPLNAAAPKKGLFGKSSSAKKASSPQLCLRTWLKRKLPTDESIIDQETSLEKSVSRHLSTNNSNTKTHKKITSTKTSAVEDSKTLSVVNTDKKTAHSTNSDDALTSIEESSTRSEEISSCSTSSPECRLSMKRSHDESEDLSGPDSPMLKRCSKCFQEEHIEEVSENTKRLKTQHTAMNHQNFSVNNREPTSENGLKILTENIQTLPSVAHLQSPRKSPQSSPSKVKRQENSENVPYRSPSKLMKRKPNSVESPVTSPKRPCLTNLVSNRHEADICNVRISLFKDNTHQDYSKNVKEHATVNTSDLLSMCTRTNQVEAQLVSSIDIKPETKQIGVSCPLSPSQTIHEHHSSRNAATIVKQPCFERSVTACKDKLKCQGSDNNDFDSPTRNLPNLVLDEANNCVTTPPNPKSFNRSQKHNWLTQIRLEKLKKSSEAASKSTNQGKLSPKVTKGMRKINSYFK